MSKEPHNTGPLPRPSHCLEDSIGLSVSVKAKIEAVGLTRIPLKYFKPQRDFQVLSFDTQLSKVFKGIPVLQLLRF